MNLVAELLLGSSRVDQWRKEISALMSMVLGFLTDNDCHVLNLEGETLLDESDTHRWMIRYDYKEGLQFRLFYRDGEVVEVACELPKGRIPLDYVGFVHFHLDSFVKGMRKLFPQLNEGWGPLLRVAREEFRMYYELHFYVPSDDPRDGEDGTLVKFRKKSDLTFPLPLNTEVFVALEGEPSKYEVIVFNDKPMFDGKPYPVDDDGDCFFRVVEYAHEMRDHYGSLYERQFTMILEPQEGWEDVPVKEHFLHLLEVNGWEHRD